jgi:D-alanyl-D-alanine carboxypeptidase
MRQLAFLAAALLLIGASSSAADDVDVYVEMQMRSLHIPGLSLAVVRDGRIVKAKGYGLANIELNVPATPATVYELGSASKQFTAVAILLLAEEGKLSLDDSIAKYFPAAPPAWKPITIRHLLTHTSGIQNHVAVPGYLRVFKMNLMFEASPSREELLDMFFKLPIEFEPGATWSYDNTGYILLGWIIEQVSGKPYWDFVDERLFKPLQMTATRNTDMRPLIPNRASGYEWVKDRHENRPVLWPFVAFSAGSFLTTVEDMARWDAALRSETLLKRAVLERMWTPARTPDGGLASFDYGYAQFIEHYGSHRLVHHSGGTPGFSSSVHRWVDDGLSVIILTNHSDRILDQLTLDIASVYDPSLRKPVRKGSGDPRTARLKEIVARALRGNFEPADFTPAMRTFLATATGKGFWQWIAAHGELGSFKYWDREESADGETLRYAVSLGGNPYWLSVRLAKDKRVAQIYWW